MRNYSRQRELILDVIKDNRIHPTAEQIYELVSKKAEKISKSTVYRNINILVKQGIILKISMTTGPDRYDYLHELHHHLTCQICGEVFDFYHNFHIDKLETTIKKQNDLDMDVSSIVVYGICEDCKSNKFEEERKWN